MQPLNEKISSKRATDFSNDSAIEITIALNAGACFGVVRAIKLGEQAILRSTTKTGEKVFSLGQLIHNPKVVNDMEARGVQTVQDPAQVTDGIAILRSHGIRKEIEADLKNRGIRLVDATCPLVKKPQRIAASLSKEGYFLVFVGDANHPEVKGVLSYFGKTDFIVTYSASEVAAIPEHVKKVGIIAQTTIEYHVLEEVTAACKARFSDVAVYNTICDATSIRQSEAEILARGADVVIVVGGKNSSNTKKLEKICKISQPDTYLIEVMEELQLGWFIGKRKIGVTGGASTPQDYVDRVGERIAEMIEQQLSPPA